ncbi:hypothetical protein AB4099_21735 [Bosea sp. 2KB_26]|uniref:hypothetical protein n=1 Tax=Bosea sp. 2KB_26 TaxID=3237475 RepID=UPI003F90D562
MNVTLGGVQIDGWDVVTFGAFAVCGMGILGALVLILGLPGRLALARNHPEAEAVNLMGWLGFLAVVPWMQALMWAFKPTDVVDLRRWPAEERRAVAEMIQNMKSKSRASASEDQPTAPPRAPPDASPPASRQT